VDVLTSNRGSFILDQNKISQPHLAGRSHNSEASRLETPNLRLECIKDEEIFAGLRVSWNAMVQRCSSRSVFLRHEWFEAAWQWRREDARLNVLCVFRDIELIGALPLIALRRTDGDYTRRLELLTVPDTQACDLLAICGEETRVAKACLARLLEKPSGWDVMRLKYLRPDACALPHLTAAAKGAGLLASISDGGRNPYLTLDGGWEAFYSTRSRRLKKANNLVANRLRKAGSVRVEWLEPGTANQGKLARVVDTAIAVSARSWKRDTGNSLDQPGPQAFVRCLSAHAAELGWLSVWLLFIDEKPCAMEYELVFEGNVHALRSDFDAEYVGTSPGSYLNRYLIEALCGRGYRHYFMGPGDNAYKFRWTDETEPLAQLTIYGRSARGRWLALWEHTLKPRLRRLRDHVAPAAKPTGHVQTDHKDPGVTHFRDGR
jgi:CelD/BcsL family acetyltransferase involved in cellulose biosynthesis